MHFNIRPSKSFFFEVLERKLKRFSGKIGLDAGSAAMKCRAMFKTDKYYGLDNRLDSLKKALETEKEGFGIWADLSKLGFLPSNSVDVVVSTNTLYCLPADIRFYAVKSLSRITAPSGVFFCEVPKYADFADVLKELKANFSKLKIIYHTNVLSRFFEWCLARDGHIKSSRFARSKFLIILAWFISRLEYITYRFPFLNKHALVICTDKKIEQKRGEFDLSEFDLVGDRIYNLIK